LAAAVIRNNGPIHLYWQYLPRRLNRPIQTYWHHLLKRKKGPFILIGSIYHKNKWAQSILLIVLAIKLIGPFKFIGSTCHEN
jgi:hypothetical protein